MRGESAFGSKSDSESATGIDALQGETPSPEWIAGNRLSRMQTKTHSMISHSDSVRTRHGTAFRSFINTSETHR